MKTSDSCSLKHKKIIEFFAGCPTPTMKYEKLIELGRNLPPYPQELKTPEHLVKGCQSQMYLDAVLMDGKIYFRCHSDALISAGLAALLLAAYNEETPENILSYPPLFLEEIGIKESLSPGRANGLASLFFKMKQICINFLIQKAKS